MAELTDTFLTPGGFCFAGPDARIHTVLGSCVSITIWHPHRRIGGMCHFILPAQPGGGLGAALRPEDQASVAAQPGRYADDAVQMFLDSVRRHGTRPDEYEVKMFGGADQFGWIAGANDLAQQNVHAGAALLSRHGFVLTSRDLGGTGSRRLTFELATGHVWLRSLTRPDRTTA